VNLQFKRQHFTVISIFSSIAWQMNVLVFMPVVKALRKAVN
jgi:hypothetical protein